MRRPLRTGARAPRRVRRPLHASSRRSFGASTTTRARPSSSSARTRAPRPRRSAAAAATTTSSRRSAARRRRASASARGSSGSCSRSSSRASRQTRRGSTSSSPSSRRQSAGRPWSQALRADGHRRRHGLRGPLAEGPDRVRAEACRPPRSSCRPTAGSLRRGGELDVQVRRHPASARDPRVTWRDTTCGDSASKTPVGASRSPAGPTRGETTAVSSSSTCATTRDSCSSSINPERAPAAAEVAHERPQRVRPPGGGRGRSPRARRRQPEPPHRRDRAPGRHAARRLRSEPLPFQVGDENVDENASPPLPLARPAQRAHAAQPPPPAPSDRRNPPRDGRARLRRHLDAEHDEGHARGRARLPRARAPAARPLLRARTVAAALQAAHA